MLWGGSSFCGDAAVPYVSIHVSQEEERHQGPADAKAVDLHQSKHLASFADRALVAGVDLHWHQQHIAELFGRVRQGLDLEAVSLFMC